MSSWAGIEKLMKYFSRNETGIRLHIFLFLFMFIHGLAWACNSKGRSNGDIISKAVLADAKHRSITVYYDSGDYARGTGLLINDQGFILTALHVILNR